MDTEKLKSDLRRDEGERLTPYFDTVGKITIGVGRNLSDCGISADEETLLLTNDINKHVAELDQHISWWRNLDEVRQRALANMCFNMGFARLSEFRNMLVALQSANWDQASKEAQDSNWYKQVGMRAHRICYMFETGEDP